MNNTFFNVEVSVVIVSYNSEQVILECIKSIELHNDLNNAIEVVIVDNSPTSILEQALNQTNFKIPLIYIHNPKNGGFGQGNNIGASFAKGRILLFLNPDTLFIEPIFKTLVKALKSDGLGVVGFRLIDSKFHPVNSFGILPELSFLGIPRFILQPLVLKFGLLKGCIYPWGASIAITRNDLLRIGFFDENIFLCYEEPDLVHRLKPAQVRMLRKRIIHLEGHAVSVNPDRIKNQFISSKYYFRKHSLSFTVFLSAHLLRSFLKLLVYRAFRCSRTEEEEIIRVSLSFLKNK